MKRFAPWLLLIFLWGTLYFVGYFISDAIWFPLIILGAAFLVYRLLFQTMPTRLRILLTLLTVGIGLYTITLNAEERYCWQKGMTADPTGVRITTALPSDTDILDMYGIQGSTVGVSFIVHMRCHQSFHFIQAMMESFKL